MRLSIGNQSAWNLKCYAILLNQRNCFIVYLYDIEKYRRRKRSIISIVLFYVFLVNQVKAEWRKCPILFYHSSLKGPQLLHMTLQCNHLKIFLHTGKNYAFDHRSVVSVLCLLFSTI